MKKQSVAKAPKNMRNSTETKDKVSTLWLGVAMNAWKIYSAPSQRRTGLLCFNTPDVMAFNDPIGNPSPRSNRPDRGGLCFGQMTQVGQF
jgi:hypothetical protein